MAEIRSTLDMVMERAARIAEETGDTPLEDEQVNRGMRMAAAYLSGGEEDLVTLLKNEPPEKQMKVRGGMAKTLLRNIILPRGGTISDQSLASLKTLQELSGNSADISNICMELQQILEQYSQHKEQIKQQFDQSILEQLKMQLQQQGMSVTEDMTLNPSMHPHYQDEWSKVVADLNGQYTEALDQRKKLIGQRFGI